ncbi:PIN domain-containing protein [bacterium]|nr:PIN domain-containing protein [bacterium]
MIIPSEWIVLDTNIWIFGLREHPEHPACTKLLKNLYRLHVKIPRQILLELQANLSKDELKEIFKLLNYLGGSVEFRWDKVNKELISKYQSMGLRQGDAVIAAHLESMNIKILVSENRDFLQKIEEPPFKVMKADEIVKMWEE